MNLAEHIEQNYRTKPDAKGRTKPRSVRWDKDGVPRDQWKRPIIVAPDGTVSGYTRISTLAKDLDSGEGLVWWKCAMTAIGILGDRTVQSVVWESEEPDRWQARLEKVGAWLPGMRIRDAFLVVIGDRPDPYYSDAKPAILALSELAQEAAGSKEKAAMGHTLHHWVQRFHQTGDITIVPQEYRKDLDAYLWATTDIRMLATEVFVAVDSVQAAGTFDGFSIHENTGKLSDLKTGSWDSTYPMAAEMQVALYSRGDIYDLTTGARTPLDCDQSEGLLIHLPQGSGSCDVYRLDLERGWRNVQIAMQMRAARKESNKKLTPIIREGIAA